MKYLNILIPLFCLTACFERKADCDQFNHETETIYHHITLLDEEIKTRVEMFDQQKPEDLMSDENYQKILELKSERDTSFRQFFERSQLYPLCPFEKSSTLATELKQYINDQPK